MKYQEYLGKYNEAKRIAEQAHENQKYGSVPYGVHLEAVQQVLERFGYEVTPDSSEELMTLRVSAWLHDALEDTRLERSHVVYHFGEEVAELVWRVTDEPGRTRKEKKAATYPKIKADNWAGVLKLADRIANVEAGLAMRNEGYNTLYKMYKKEWEGFRQELYSKGVADEMWKHLDQLFKN